MNSLHTFLKQAQSALKTVFPAFSAGKTKQEKAGAFIEKKTAVMFPAISDVSFLQKKRAKKNTIPALEKETGSLSVSFVEKSAFIAFQQDYAGNGKSFSSAEPVNHFQQSQKLLVNVHSGLRPLPVGMVKMLDLYKNSIQSFLI